MTLTKTDINERLFHIASKLSFISLQADIPETRADEIKAAMDEIVDLRNDIYTEVHGEGNADPQE